MLSYAQPVHGYHSLASGHGLPYVCRRTVIVRPGRIYINYVSFPRLGLLCKWLCTVASDVSDRVCAHRTLRRRRRRRRRRSTRTDLSDIPFRPATRDRSSGSFPFDDELRISRGSFKDDLRIFGRSDHRGSRGSTSIREDPARATRHRRAFNARRLGICWRAMEITRRNFAS